MKAAVVVEAGQAPVYQDFKQPASEPGKSLIRVTASSISHITRNRASGTHYSSDSELPFVPGLDGVGTTEDGKHVYFILPEKPFGGMAEWSLVDNRQVFPLPAGLDDVTAAALAIPGMSSWAALVERAHLQRGETVLINGATGSSGRLAIQIAKHLGAAKVIATGRNANAFDELKALGADVVVQLADDKDALEHAFKKEFQQGIDIVLDYLWGSSAEALLIAAAKAGPEGRAIRFVQIGSMSGANISLPGAALRSSGLLLMGSGINSVPFPKLYEAIQKVLDAAPVAGFKIATQAIALSDITRAWGMGNSTTRTVLIP